MNFVERIAFRVFKLHSSVSLNHRTI